MTRISKPLQECQKENLEKADEPLKKGKEDLFNMSFIEFKNVTKEYGSGQHILKALDNLSFVIGRGEFVVILGPSGAGKSTVLNLLGGMDRATSGSICIDGQTITGFKDKALTDYRGSYVGFVFQFYNLIPNLTAYENVALIREVVKNSQDARTALESVGLGDHLNQFPAQLSGGEQQRVSIARAISKNPRLLLCDEPTGALDSNTGTSILSLLQKLSREKGQTTVIVTHNSLLAPAASRVIKLKNGKVSEQHVNPFPVDIKEINW